MVYYSYRAMWALYIVILFVGKPLSHFTVLLGMGSHSSHGDLGQHVMLYRCARGHNASTQCCGGA